MTEKRIKLKGGRSALLREVGLDRYGRVVYELLAPADRTARGHVGKLLRAKGWTTGRTTGRGYNGMNKAGWVKLEQ